MHSIQVRISHLWYLFWWCMTLVFVVLVYYGMLSADVFHFSPTTLTIIDNIYKTFCGLILTAIVANILSLIFHEVKYSLGVSHPFLWKFLPTIRFLVLFLVWILGGFFILESIRVNTNGLLAGAGIGGAIFALASKDIIANLLGSLSIIMSKTFDIGDTIRIKGIEGIVEEINLNYTKMMSTEGKVVYVPNRTLNIEYLENITRRRFYLYTFKVPFKKAGNSPSYVEDTLMYIEGKLGEYDPIEITMDYEIPNAVDFVYVFSVKLPLENREFERDIRSFLIPYIFPVEEKKTS